jgi:drug/metabolite transporter (DMT)-like permease
MLWVALSGLLFTCLNTIVRHITLTLDGFESQFLRYFFGFLVMVPLLIKEGWRSYIPVDMKGQFWRGAVHTLGLLLWFAALPKIALADMTAIGFSGPIFIMIGAGLFLGEPMRRDRWIAALFGLLGVVVVVAPKLSGQGGWYTLVMFASTPVFAASFLMTKSLTKFETPGVIVFWQAISVSLFSLPLAAMVWQTPTAMQWLGFVAAGLLGSLGHYCLTRGFKATDISATQSLRFLDLIWSATAGYLVFGDVPSEFTVLGAVVILSSTIWIARREGRAVSVVTDASLVTDVTNVTNLTHVSDVSDVSVVKESLRD